MICGEVWGDFVLKVRTRAAEFYTYCSVAVLFVGRQQSRLNVKHGKVFQHPSWTEAHELL